MVYKHLPEVTVENVEVKLLWDTNIQCDNIVEARRPDIVIVSKKESKCIFVDIAIPGDSRVHEKEFEKVEKYQDLKRKVGRMWGIKNMDVVQVVVGALGSVTKNLGQWIKLGIRELELDCYRKLRY